MNKFAYLKCVKCGQTFPLDKGPLTCPNHSPYYGYLGIFYDYSNINGFREPDGHVWSKYLPLLPISKYRIHLNEKKTPLIKAERYGKTVGISNLWIKDESKNPTGSFKDRESIVAINMALELGINDLLTVSSGNAAVSTSAYAQKAGLTSICLVPKNLSVGKRILLSLYGAKIRFVGGDYEQIYRQVIDHSDSAWNVTPGLNPYKEEGVKSLGFEIWEELGVPDLIVVPCGNGTLLWAVFKAFWELKILGKINNLPRMIGVQISGAAPLARAFSQKQEFVVLESAPDSIAEGIIARESYSSPKVMQILKMIVGEIIEISELELKKALKEIITDESIIPEPTSAAAFAGLKKLTGIENKTVVVVNTASGVKNLKEIMESYIK